MSSRTPLVVGNWKAAPTQAEVTPLSKRLIQTLTPQIQKGLELVVCPPFPWLPDVARELAGSNIGVGAQTMAGTEGGSATGEIPASLLRGMCGYALIGHYERRILCGEKDGAIRKKIEAALEGGIKPILCVGETAEALESGGGATVVTEQIEGACDGLKLDPRLIIAYAPAWTGMGRIMPPGGEYANEICRVIRETLAVVSSDSLAEQVRIIAGGRLAQATIGDLVSQPEIDGLFISAGATNADVFGSYAAAMASARLSENGAN